MSSPNKSANKSENVPLRPLRPLRMLLAFCIGAALIVGIVAPAVALAIDFPMFWKQEAPADITDPFLANEIDSPEAIEIDSPSAHEIDSPAGQKMNSPVAHEFGSNAAFEIELPPLPNNKQTPKFKLTPKIKQTGWRPVQKKSPVRTAAFVETGSSVADEVPAPPLSPIRPNEPASRVAPSSRVEPDSWPNGLTGGKTGRGTDNIDPNCPNCATQEDSWQLLPDGLLYKSYLAGPKEPRFGIAWLHERNKGWIWDASLGGRVGIFRYGTPGAVLPEGWQLDIEGGAFPRLNSEQSSDLESADFRFGVPLTWARGPLQMKLGYYHISSHVGDEFLIRNPTFQRVNYVRDSFLFGVGYFVSEHIRVYAEMARAFQSDIAEPWEFQFGVENSPQQCNGRRGAPFWAVNVQLFEEQDFGGGVNAMAGWQWRSEISDRLMRVGLQYYNGKSNQYAFFNEHEELLGFGIWFDY